VNHVCKKREFRFSAVNYNNPEHPEFEDNGEVVLTEDNGATCHIRLDWFSPDALLVWGDGRIYIVGTDGYMELIKYINVGEDSGGTIYSCAISPNAGIFRQIIQQGFHSSAV
jgi:hypothetical protein